MRLLRVCAALMCLFSPVLAQEKPDGPTDEKARKRTSKPFNSYASANRGLRSAVSRRPTNRSQRIDRASSLTQFWVVVRRDQQAIGWGKRPC